MKGEACCSASSGNSVHGSSGPATALRRLQQRPWFVFLPTFRGSLGYPLGLALYGLYNLHNPASRALLRCSGSTLYMACATVCS